MSLMLQSVFGFFLTAIVGGWIANRWQQRAIKEARFFDASRLSYDRMTRAAEDLSALSGRRVYAAQRVCLLDGADNAFPEAVAQFRKINLEWNERLMEIELSIRTLFRHSQLTSFENIQQQMANVTRAVGQIAAGDESISRKRILSDLVKIRHRLFQFIQEMIREAALLNRQMHFGVRVEYDSHGLDRLSNLTLIKLLFVSSIESDSIVRPPSDFGMPVSAREARLGINE
ncbi:hypothetical protein [Sphingobium sp. CFD-1]|uniref:hypothetical protein n=1 Tax=Sphingobium sp. CFD-1 TaxID=2878545 RepID=UPI00214CF24D|nr:hypothetical protein [Sphingobium sp. CFD-1]